MKNKSMESYQKQVKQVFLKFLERKSYRKTPERFSILEEIYEFQGHFDIDILYELMKKNNYRVSRATIYNTLDLLQECNLIRKHQFGQNQSYYEKSFFNKQHDHLILDDGTIEEFCDPRIESIKKSIEAVFEVDIKSHSLYFYGTRKNKK